MHISDNWQEISGLGPSLRTKRDLWKQLHNLPIIFKTLQTAREVFNSPRLEHLNSPRGLESHVSQSQTFLRNKHVGWKLHLYKFAKTIFTFISFSPTVMGVITVYICNGKLNSISHPLIGFKVERFQRTWLDVILIARFLTGKVPEGLSGCLERREAPASTFTTRDINSLLPASFSALAATNQMWFVKRRGRPMRPDCGLRPEPQPTATSRPTDRQLSVFPSEPQQLSRADRFITTSADVCVILRPRLGISYNADVWTIRRNSQRFLHQSKHSGKVRGVKI